MRFEKQLATLALIGVLAATKVHAQQATPKMATDIPTEITTPDRVETRIGTLN